MVNNKTSLLNKKYDRSKFTLSNSEIWDKLIEIKGNDFKNYREILKNAEKGQVLTNFPTEVLIKTTLNCNHSCPRCPHGMGLFPHGQKYNMKFETFKKALDEGVEKGLKSIVFTGGEPTLHPKIIDFIEYAGSKKFPDISLITNGSLLTDKLIDCILENSITRVNISFDSITPSVYKEVRGVNDYEKVLKNIDRLIEKRDLKGGKLPLISISFVLFDNNAHELDDFINIWKDKADGGIKIYPYKNFYSVLDEAFYTTYGEGKNKLQDIEKKDLPKNLSHEIPIMEEYSIQCTVPWYRCTLGINGEIQACTTVGFCDHPEMIMGNINEMTFESAWKSDKWASLREITLNKQYDKHPICKVCQKSV